MVSSVFRKSLVAATFIMTATLVMTSCAGLSADAVVYDNGAGGAAGINNAYQSDPDSGQLQSDDFFLQVETLISGVEWTGVYAGNNSPQDDSFTINIMEDTGNGPSGGTPLETFNIGENVSRTDSGFDVSGFDIYNFSADLGFLADAGTTYWISIVNDTSNDPDDNWYWGNDTTYGNMHNSSDNGSFWQQFSATTDFRLKAVPEPGSGLIISVLSATALLRRRRRS